MKTATLTGVQLDYAVALAEGYKFGAPRRLPNAHFYLFPLSRPDWKTLGAVALHSDGWGENVPRFSTGPAGDEIIDRRHISVVWLNPADGWAASFESQAPSVLGATRRIAAMRAWCLFKHGPEIELHEVVSRHTNSS